MKILSEFSKITLTLMTFLMVSLMASSILGYVITKKVYLIEAIEHGYFEGQKDAINKDIRIKLDSDSTYKWIKSPWNDNKPPIFIPNHENTLK